MPSSCSGTVCTAGYANGGCCASAPYCTGSSMTVCSATCGTVFAACQATSDCCSGFTCSTGVCLPPVDAGSPDAGTGTCLTGSALCTTAGGGSAGRLVLGTVHCGDTTGSTTNHSPNTCFTGAVNAAPQQDWYFTASSTRSHTITVVPAATYRAEVFLRSVATCTTTGCLTGAVGTSAGATVTLTYSMTSGTTYVVIVGPGISGSSGSYTIRVQ